MVEFPGFDKVTFMQDMTSAQCYHAEIGETKQLVDKRDNKKYWVTKLKDGNCWMTQNLDYDDPNSTKITSPEEWVNSITEPYYLDPGEKFVGVNEDSGKLVDAVINSETDRHYLVGNYYNFTSAMAGTDLGIEQNGQNATDSICPSEWKLPTSGMNTEGKPSTANGSFGRLIESYQTGNVTMAPGILRNSPFYFTATGWAGSALNQASVNALYWSSTISSATASYYLLIGFESSLGIQPSRSGGSRNSMNPIRCLVLGS